MKKTKKLPEGLFYDLLVEGIMPDWFAGMIIAAVVCIPGGLFFINFDRVYVVGSRMTEIAEMVVKILDVIIEIASEM